MAEQQLDGAQVSAALWIVCVAAGVLAGARARGWRARWLAPAAWPTTFGDFFSGDYGHGIKGFWGRAWHSLFRPVFTAPASWIVRVGGLERRGVAAKMVRLGVPFVASAFFHMSGAWVMAFEGWGAVTVFLMQPVGILIETLAAMAWKAAVRRPEGAQPGRVVWAFELLVPYIWGMAFFTVVGFGFFEEYRYAFTALS